LWSAKERGNARPGGENLDYFINCIERYQCSQVAGMADLTAFWVAAFSLALGFLGGGLKGGHLKGVCYYSENSGQFEPEG
jgi:hypothetical protein